MAVAIGQSGLLLANSTLIEDIDWPTRESEVRGPGAGKREAACTSTERVAKAAVSGTFYSPKFPFSSLLVQRQCRQCSVTGPALIASWLLALSGGEPLKKRGEGGHVRLSGAENKQRRREEKKSTRTVRSSAC